MKKEEIIKVLLNIAESLDAGEDAIDRYIYAGFENDVKALREAARMIDQMPHWISVNDILPCENEDVLLCFKDEKNKKCDVMAVGIRQESICPYFWWHTTNGDVKKEGQDYMQYYTLCEAPPLYWMQLPEPPKEQTDEKI